MNVSDYFQNISVSTCSFTDPTQIHPEGPVEDWISNFLVTNSLLCLHINTHCEQKTSWNQIWSCGWKVTHVNLIRKLNWPLKVLLFYTGRLKVVKIVSLCRILNTVYHLVPTLRWTCCNVMNMSEILKHSMFLMAAHDASLWHIQDQKNSATSARITNKQRCVWTLFSDQNKFLMTDTTLRWVKENKQLAALFCWCFWERFLLPRRLHGFLHDFSK